MTIYLAKQCESVYTAVADIEKQCFHEPWSANAVKEFLSFDYNAILCAYEQDTLCGYISFSEVCDEYQIANVAVDKSVRNKGIAFSLLQALHEEAKKHQISQITLDVRVSNIPAVSLYKKSGYETVATHPKFYRFPTEDAYIMTYHPISER